MMDTKDKIVNAAIIALIALILVPLFGMGAIIMWVGFIDLALELFGIY